MPVPAPQSDGLPCRLTRTLLSPWSRLALLLALLASAAAAMLAWQPQDLLVEGWPGHTTDTGATALFALGYGLCTAAFVPRPVLNLAAGALFGAQFGTLAAVAGTVLGAGICFGLGRALGQCALRRLLLRGRRLDTADRYLSRHGFRSTLVLRMLPGIPFAASNYGAAVSQMRWPAFLAATALGSIPNTAAYTVAGSSVATPTSPAFLVSFGFIAVSGLLGAGYAWRRRARIRRVVTRGPATPPASAERTPVGATPPSSS